MMSAKPHYLIDTHALIWYLKSDHKLSPIARQVFESAQREEAVLVIHAVALAELYFANKRLAMFADYPQFYQSLAQRSYILLVDFTTDQTLDFPALELIPEMHDRILVGTARRLGIPFVTRDPMIIQSGLVATVW